MNARIYALMIGGAIINATAFVGGSCLAKYLSGSNHEEERKRHDLAVEKYQSDYDKYLERRSKLYNWIQTNDRIKSKAKQDLSNTDYSLKLYYKLIKTQGLI